MGTLFAPRGALDLGPFSMAQNMRGFENKRFQEWFGGGAYSFQLFRKYIRECNSLVPTWRIKKTFKNFGFYLFWVLILFYGRWAGWESRVETLLGLLRASFSVYMTQTVLSSVIQTQPGRPPKPIFLPHACSKVLLRSICIFFSYFNQQKAKRFWEDKASVYV